MEINKKELKELTKEQVALFEEAKNEYLNRFFHDNSYDKEKLIGGAKWIYRLAKLKEPEVRIVRSYKERVNDFNQMQDQVQVQVWNRVSNQIRDQVRSQVWNQVKTQVSDQVQNEMWTRVWEQVSDQVQRVSDQVQDQVRRQMDRQWWLLSGETWLLSGENMFSYWRTFEKLGIVKNENFRKYYEFLFAGGWSAFFYENIAYIILIPEKIIRNEQNRLHSDTEAAILWRDGTKMHFVEGVFFDESVFEKMKSKTLTVKEAKELINVEQRTIAMRKINKTVQD